MKGFKCLYKPASLLAMALVGAFVYGALYVYLSQDEELALAIKILEGHRDLPSVDLIHSIVISSRD